jgi:CheY-like chemotaxis protein
MKRIRKILIVDDQLHLRTLLKVALGVGKYEVHEAASGEQALQMAANIKPDMMLLDVMMPGGMNGFDVCQQIKASPELQHIFVVMLTAMGQQADRERGAQVHADAYVVKPFSPLELLELIEKVMPSR